MILGVSLLGSKYIDEIDRRPVYWCNTACEQGTTEFIELLSQRLQSTIEARTAQYEKWAKGREVWKADMFAGHYSSKPKK